MTPSLILLGAMALGSLGAPSSAGARLAAGGDSAALRECPPGALIVYPGASDVSFFKSKHGIWYLSYTVSIPYPAEPVLEYLRKELARRGWTPSPEDASVAGDSPSPSKDWVQYDTDVGKPGTRIDERAAEWRDAAGAVIGYDLRYESDGTGIGRQSLNVQASFESREVLEAQRREERARASRAPCGKSGPVEVRLAYRTEKGVGGAVLGPGGDWFMLDRDPLVNACEFRGADVQESAGHCVVTLRFSREVADRLMMATSAWQGQRIAVAVYGQIVAAPPLTGPIGDLATIEMDSCEKARAFVADLPPVPPE